MARYGRAYREARRRVVREATFCMHCGKPISDELPMGHPNKATADHIIPIADGGTHSVENLGPSCGPCNSSRGDKGTNWRPSPMVAGAEDW